MQTNMFGLVIAGYVAPAVLHNVRVANERETTDEYCHAIDMEYLRLEEFNGSND